MPEESEKFRRLCLQNSRALGPEEVVKSGEEVAERLFASPFFQAVSKRGWQGVRVGLYRSMPSELALLPVEERLRREGARAYFPRVVDRASGRMEFSEMPKEARFERGHYGIEEPPSSSPVVDPAELQLIFVPGVAFGRGGERIGRGAGFYDRFLARASRALRVSLAFDFQLFDQLPQGPFDQSVHWVFTPQCDIVTEIGERGLNEGSLFW